ILNKRNGFRLAFCSWDIKAVAGFGTTEIEILCTDQEIIRNRLKIQAVIENARIIDDIQAKYGSFCKWFYDILPGTEYPGLYIALRKTFRFMGPETSRMWLMASGRITEHEGHKYRPQ
ncbi:DNA-3-methyladenine glycosylase I, partial [Dehalococcoidia bacterium]|nr:DNA-3-methyladenine glycosylase I [Dehalococcoidia bacterium]